MTTSTYSTRDAWASGFMFSAAAMLLTVVCSRPCRPSPPWPTTTSWSRGLSTPITSTLRPRDGCTCSSWSPDGDGCVPVHRGRVGPMGRVAFAVLGDGGRPCGWPIPVLGDHLIGLNVAVIWALAVVEIGPIRPAGAVAPARPLAPAGPPARPQESAASARNSRATCSPRSARNCSDRVPGRGRRGGRSPRQRRAGPRRPPRPVVAMISARPPARSAGGRRPPPSRPGRRARASPRR